MTDRASAEGLRERVAAHRVDKPINSEGAFWNAGIDAALAAIDEFAALRDTGPRLDSGIDVERLARAMHASEVGCARPTSLCVWEAPFSESHRALATAIAAEYARLSTPRTETSDD